MRAGIGHISKGRLEIDITDEMGLIVKLRQDFGAVAPLQRRLIQP